MFENILLAADGSVHSLRAAEKAICLIKNKETADIKVVYVVDSSTSKSDVLKNLDDHDIAEKRKQKLKDIFALLESSGVKHELKVIHGEPGETLVEYANNHKFDCLVIGSRGLNRFQSMVLGGVSHTVAKGAKCPVMIVK
ncbi:universal stress protein [Bacillaceae bacterium IKA-2]|nr:universal stress protein [Bacillaceae bacterium IKA-2]